MADQTYLDQIPLRVPSPSEMDYFKKNLHVGGMATEDNHVILNPFSTLSPREKDAVVLNERARIHMRGLTEQPTFALTPDQQSAFASYGSPQDMRATIAARILSGDPSALTATPDQQDWVAHNLKPIMTNPKQKAMEENLVKGLQ